VRSTSQIRPGFSVTIAKFEAGRKSIAQGESKVATGFVTNGEPLAGAAEAWLLVVAEVPHAAKARSPT
jgi:hypothetical protein